jgi:signal transduction histidine kinase
MADDTARSSPFPVLIITAALCVLPLALVGLFPGRLDRVLDPPTYLVVHTTAEFFSIMVSLSIFGVGWFTSRQSNDRHAVFLGVAFLAIGLLDFMHLMSNAAMPAFFTPNSTNKSTQFWVAARFIQAVAVVAGAFLYGAPLRRGVTLPASMAGALLYCGAVFTAVIFIPGRTPATWLPGTGLTVFKRAAEYVIVGLFAAAAVGYLLRFWRLRDRRLLNYVTALLLCIASELSLAFYTRVFDTWNVLGHLYKVAAFFFVYRGVFVSAVRDPYTRLAEANERIGGMNVQLEQRVSERTRELEAAAREMEAFNYSVSHDLRGPLSLVRNLTAEIESRHGGLMPVAARELLGFVRTAAAEMEQLIQGLLRLFRLSRTPLERKRVDLAVIGRRLAQELCQQDPRRSVQVVIGDRLDVDGDETLMTAVLQNLFSNAWKFTAGRAAARVELGSRDIEGKNTFFVSDNGVGFDMAYAGKLFTPFERLHSAAEYPGSGIGLATVKRIIERHGGRIWAEAGPGTGAAFFFTL